MAAPDMVGAYDDTWPATFETLRSLVEPVLRGVRHEIEHVGSTAVPGLDAKPIVDLDVVVGSPADVPQALAALESAGWKHRGDLASPAGKRSIPVPT